MPARNRQATRSRASESRVGSNPDGVATPDDELRERLREAEETLQAIRSGEVDALIVEGTHGAQVYTLKGADEPYRVLVEEMSEGAVTLLSDGTILYCNRRLSEMLRAPLNSIIGSSIYNYVAEQHREAVGRLLAGVITRPGTAPPGAGDGSERREARETHNIEVALLARGAEGRPSDPVPVYLSGGVLPLDGVASACIVVTDLTEQKRNEEIVQAGKQKLAEEQLKANKLEAVGILAGGLAHDLNNSLTAMLGNISLAKRAAAGDDVLLRRLGEAEAACLQARDVSLQLLTFSKGGVPVKRTLALGPLLKDWTTFALSGSNVAAEFAISRSLWPVEMDEGQMSRVISNLVMNAQQAMPAGGIIILRAENLTLEQGDIDAAGLPLQPGRYVRMSIQDRGSGIPRSHLSRIFDPYFTTKQRGSGLGLAICYSVVRSHNGHIAAESELGVGSTFSVYLPAAGAMAPERTEPEPRRRKHGLRVLVMDDQEAIREVIGEILTQMDGDEVAFAADGEDAVRLYTSALEVRRPFDVVMVDLTVAGGMGGKDTMARLLQLDPGATGIVFSGYSNDPIMAHYGDYGFKGVLRKPFSIEELLDEIRRVVDRE